MKTSRYVVVVAAAAVVLVAAATNAVWSQSDSNGCTNGNGRYQMAMVLAPGGKASVFEAILDTCTGKVVRRGEVYPLLVKSRAD